MPKEVIYGALEAIDNEEVAIAELSWGRTTQWVQMGVLLVKASTHDRVKREVDGGYYLTLSRDSINQLIRTLRRARDHAFGADE